MIANAQVELQALEKDLLSALPRWLLRGHRWADDITENAGVYVVWDSATGEPVYVGQTSGLRKRMVDIGRSVNHTFRRKVSKLLNVWAGDDKALTEAMSQRYRLSFIEVRFGRAELEDYVRLRWQRTLLNGPAARLAGGTQYDWVTDAKATCPIAPRRASS